MSNKNAKKYHIIPNHEYGPYLTIEEIERQGHRSIERVWRVIHLITNKERIMRPSYLIIVQKKYTTLLDNKNYQNGLKKYLYEQYIRGANKRNHKFFLTFDEFINIISQNCHYCGEPPKRATSKMLITRGHINEPPLYYNGIDRKNPQLDYDIENSIPCCTFCNYMKHTMNYNEFICHIKKIHNHLILDKKICLD